MAESDTPVAQSGLSGTEVTILLAGLGFIIAIVAIYPPQGPQYPYLAYTLAIPSIALGTALALRPVRKAISAAYDWLGGARAIVTSCALAVLAALALLWYQYLPGPAQIVIAQTVFPAFVVQALPAPSTPPPQTPIGPVVFDTPTPPVPTSAPDQIPPAVAAQLRQRDQQIADLMARLEAAESAKAAAEQEADRQRAAADVAREQAAAAPPPSGPAPTTPNPTPANPAPVRSIPQLPPVVPTSNVLETLSAYLILGQNLRALYVRENAADAVEQQVNAWYRASLGYIGQNLGVDYAARYRTATGSGLAIHNFPMAKMGMVDGIDSRLQHLVSFLTEIRNRR
jgi:hypothetical protein